MQLTNNTILITGGGSGIGQALAIEFHKLGNTVVIAGRTNDKLDETTKANPGIKSLIVDMAIAESVRAVIKKIEEDYPALNAVIHCAGIMRPEKIKEGKLDDAEATVQLNLMGSIRLTAGLLPVFKKQERATIITVSSGLAFVPMAATPTYCATKAAIHSYTQSLRFQLKDTAIQVIELIPPYVQTHLMGEQQAHDEKAMPLKDFITEVMTILRTSPEGEEIIVEKVKAMRFAEKNGNYEAAFAKGNSSNE